MCACVGVGVVPRTRSYSERAHRTSPLARAARGDVIRDLTMAGAPPATVGLNLTQTRTWEDSRVATRNFFSPRLFSFVGYAHVLAPLVVVAYAPRGSPRGFPTERRRATSWLRKVPPPSGKSTPGRYAAISIQNSYVNSTEPTAAVTHRAGVTALTANLYSTSEVPTQKGYSI